MNSVIEKMLLTSGTNCTIKYTIRSYHTFIFTQI